MTRLNLCAFVLLASALLGCGDDDDELATPDGGSSETGGRDAGVGGRGGIGDDGGGAARGGRGALPMNPPRCTRKRSELSDWCEMSDSKCSWSTEEFRQWLCGLQKACRADVACTRSAYYRNTCGGVSASVIYGIDVEGVTHHFDASGALVGVKAWLGGCIGGSDAQDTTTYGEDCAFVGNIDRWCSTGDGGTDDSDD